MNSIVRTLVPAMLLLALAGCADTKPLRTDIDSLKSQVGKLQSEVSAVKASADAAARAANAAQASAHQAAQAASSAQSTADRALVAAQSAQSSIAATNEKLDRMFGKSPRHWHVARRSHDGSRRHENH
jgi:outer membrane murein-binding lipoprotein Lpp